MFEDDGDGDRESGCKLACRGRQVYIPFPKTIRTIDVVVQTRMTIRFNLRFRNV